MSAPTTLRCRNARRRAILFRSRHESTRASPPRAGTMHSREAAMFRKTSTHRAPPNRARAGFARSPSTTGSSLGGSVLASFALAVVGYLHLLNLSGVGGFAVCWYFVFLAGLRDRGLHRQPPPHCGRTPRRRHAVPRCRTRDLRPGLDGRLHVRRGLAAPFVISTSSPMTWPACPPSAPLNQGGILHAIVGTLIMVGIAVVVAVPLGIGTAVYMTEVRGPGSHLIRTVVEAMTALSDILAGLFVYALLVVGLRSREDRSGRRHRHRGDDASPGGPSVGGGAAHRSRKSAPGERGPGRHALEDDVEGRAAERPSGPGDRRASWPSPAASARRLSSW